MRCKDGWRLARIYLLFIFASGGGMFGQPTLPTNWIADWTRIYDFSGIPGVDSHPDSKVTRNIDLFNSSTLHDMPEFSSHSNPDNRALPVRNLIRGSRLGLPTAQAIAQSLGIAELTAAELGSGADGQVAASKGFDTETPLWYYVLKEAQIQKSGETLGELGSRIVSEVFVGLIRGSQHSILCEDCWEPTLPSSSKDHFQMPDLIAFVGDTNPIGEREASVV